MVVNRIDTLPKLAEGSDEKDVQENMELLEYLHTHYVVDKVLDETPEYFEKQKPDYLKR